MTDEPKQQDDLTPQDPLADLEENGILAEFWDFMRVRKKFWLAPIILALVLLGLLFAAAMKTGAIAPFIYAM